jgi:hypothetical protein
MKIHSGIQEEHTDIIKKRTIEVYTIYGRDFKSEHEAIEYGVNCSSNELDKLLKELDHMIGKKGIPNILKQDTEFLGCIGDAIQEHRAMLIRKEKLHRETTYAEQ